MIWLDVIKALAPALIGASVSIFLYFANRRDRRNEREADERKQDIVKSDASLPPRSRKHRKR
ncbi:hypothetical protein BC351_10445 [Paenibacillus ferrarius]|uniref:Uncharacterized protein n=1 Tax=Paenibacillus ferrarius TaxID=1469647 RepID=A0A1V4H9F1_9BACL|nr:hypothetical protein BC351_10445 [Paenibacillus ferrarius]